MNLLLDTHTLLWFLANAPKLSPAARTAILDPNNARWVSTVSLLEIALKHRIGKLPLPDPFAVMFPASLTASDVHLLPLDLRHIEPLTRLPLHHRDPFDRLLASKALVEQMTFVSADPVFDQYGLSRLW